MFYVIIYIANNDLNFNNGNMSKVCFFCGKSVSFGGHRKHKYGGGWAYRAQRTPRKFKPNMRKIKIRKRLAIKEKNGPRDDRTSPPTLPKSSCLVRSMVSQSICGACSLTCIVFMMD